MEPENCDHTIHHVAEDGYLDGSWTTDTTEHGTRIVCGACGKFYGYLQNLSTPPLPRPAPRDPDAQKADTSSSFCSGPKEQGTTLPPPAALPRRPAPARGGIDYALLRRQVTISQVLELIDFHPVSRSGSQVRGPCPVHRSSSEKSRVFSVNLEKNTYQCFGRKCGSKGNQLDLYVAVTGLPIYEAALELCEKLGIDVPRKEAR
jgi:hypothetical protein